jgi:Zn-dependent protease with chaperone function
MAIKTGVAGVLIGYITGDVSVIATAIPTVLINSSYSRDFEREADEHAVKELKEMNVSTKYVAELFEALAKDHEEEENNNSLLGMLASHPLTSERIDYFKAYAN